MTHEQEGKKIPQVTFRTRDGDDWKNVTTDSIFAGKTVVVFALPGAFTPTCSSTHLPRYEELAARFADNGVDEICCVSVNDAFVMNAWGRDQGVGSVRLLPDGNGEFSAGMGMLVGKEDLGFGKRSWRYSMLVRDGVIEKMFVEPEVTGDPFEVSDADTMLEYLAPGAAKVPDISLFTSKGCGYCEKARTMLDERKLPYEEIEIGNGITRSSIRAITGADSTPQIFVDGIHVGGAEELGPYLEAREEPRG